MGRPFEVPKQTGTYADVLFATGIADLLLDAHPAQDIRLVDLGKSYAVECPSSVEDAVRNHLRSDPGYRFIVEKGTEGPQDQRLCFAERERERAQRFFEQYSALRKDGKQAAEIQELLTEQRPAASWSREQSVLQLKGHDAANKLAAQVASLANDELRAQVGQGLTALSAGHPSGVAWKADAVQVFNPPAAKGYARLKPDSTDRNDGTGDAWADPLREWLRVRGYHRAAVPFTGPKASWIRVIVPVPKDISLNSLSVVALELPRSGVRSASEAKLDALAALSLAELLVERCEENQEPRAIKLPGLSLRGRRPSSVVSGIQIAHFQKASQFAYTLGSLQSVAVPGWFDIHGPEDVRSWLKVLDEHRAAVLSLDEKRSDEIGILLTYRRFLQSPGEEGGLAVAEAFLDFLGQYGCFLLRARERGKFAPQFTRYNIRRVLMGLTNAYTTILGDRGFIAVAAAVRKATVSAQAAKAICKKKGRRYQGIEIRYDLVPELRRKHAASPEEFMEVVCRFVSEYNTDNAKRLEQRAGDESLPVPSRNVTTAEFRSFAGLVEEYGASKVGALLCAFGTCRDPKEIETDSDDPSEATPEEALDED